ncbi:MAG: hypothetical protein MSS51_01500 [Bacteroidales bacterium]|nr:hypothetical protein [Bacteroidales bacterium]
MKMENQGPRFSSSIVLISGEGGAHFLVGQWPEVGGRAQPIALSASQCLSLRNWKEENNGRTSKGRYDNTKKILTQHYDSKHKINQQAETHNKSTFERKHNLLMNVNII